MIKKLQRVGNSYGIIINKPILDLLGIDPDSRMEITPTADGGLNIRPIKAEDHRARVRESGKRMLEIHRETFEKLAK